jgi:hypothetical protein
MAWPLRRAEGSATRSHAQGRPIPAGQPGAPSTTSAARGIAAPSISSEGFKMEA